MGLTIGVRGEGKGVRSEQIHIRTRADVRTSFFSNVHAERSWNVMPYPDASAGVRPSLCITPRSDPHPDPTDTLRFLKGSGNFVFNTEKIWGFDYRHQRITMRMAPPLTAPWDMRTQRATLIFLGLFLLLTDPVTSARPSKVTFPWYTFQERVRPFSVSTHPAQSVPPVASWVRPWMHLIAPCLEDQMTKWCSHRTRA